MVRAMARRDGMDAHDGVSAQGVALARLRDAAGAYAADGDAAPLRDVVRVLAADAAARGMRAEELVIAFKQLWTSVPELHPLRRQARGIVDELVTLCINEFYRSRGDSAR